jgi:hypothetical protein
MRLIAEVTAGENISIAFSTAEAHSTCTYETIPFCTAAKLRRLAKMAITTSVNHSIGTLTLTFPEHGELILHAERMSEALRQYAMMDRLTAKVVDCMAIERDKFPDRVVPEAVKFERASAMIKHLESGTDEWNPGRAANGSSDKYLLNRAWMEAYGAPIKPDVLKGLTARKIAAALAMPDIKPLIDKYEAEAVANVDVGALMEELMA